MYILHIFNTNNIYNHLYIHINYAIKLKYVNKKIIIEKYIKYTTYDVKNKFEFMLATVIIFTKIIYIQVLIIFYKLYKSVLLDKYKII